MRTQLLLVALVLAACPAGPPSEPITEPPTEPPTEEPPTPAPSAEPLILRLTSSEVNRAISDLLEVEVPPWRFPAAFTIDGFVGRFAAQAPSDALIEEQRRAAVHASTYVAASPRFATCLQTDPAPCAEAVLRFADEAWRRPLDGESAARLRGLFDASLETLPEPDPLLAARLAVQAVLQSPRFLYRVELGLPEEGPRPLDGWELAARLAFLLWDSVPDAALRASAASDALLDPVELEAQARRLLADPRAHEAVLSFHRQWLELEGIEAIAPSWDVHFPSAGDEDTYVRTVENTRRVLRAEVDRFVEHVLFEGDGTLHALLTDTTAWVSPLTAPGYGLTQALPELPSYSVAGLDGVSLPLDPVRLPAAQRAGVLTLAGPLAARAHPVHPSPVHRGLLVLERLLCAPPDDPPPGAQLAAPPDLPEAPDTNRARLEAATDVDGCRGCHADINPPGFAFEHYDAVGRWRDEDFGAPIDASGALLTEEIPFDGAVQLVTALADADPVYACYAAWWMQYALGRGLEEGDAAAQQAVLERFLDSGEVSELLVSLVTSEAFRVRPGGTP